MKRKVGENLKL